MYRFSFKIWLTTFAIAVAATCASAQIRTDNGRIVGNPPALDDDMPKNIEETLARRRIEQSKKDFQELLDRSEEAVKLSDELSASSAMSSSLNSTDQKKLDRLEKLVKKIRTELGADDDEKDDNADGDAANAEETPSTVPTAIRSLRSNAVKLLDEVKKSTRYSISVVSVQTANTLLRLVKFLRLNR